MRPLVPNQKNTQNFSVSKEIIKNCIEMIIYDTILTCLIYYSPNLLFISGLSDLSNIRGSQQAILFIHQLTGLETYVSDLCK